MRARDGGRGLASAVSFLTRLPAGRASFEAEDLARGVAFFPLVAALVGASTALVAIGFSRFLPTLIAALLTVGWQALVTGWLHLDGLADTADSYGAPDRARALEIMRDHSIGTFGTLALVLDLSLKAAAIAALLGSADVLGPVVAATTLGSLAILPGMLLPYAGSGTGRFLRGAGPVPGIAAAAIAALVVAVSVGFRLFPATAAAVVVGALWGWHCRRRLSGVTGDTLGAASELIQLAVLLTLVAVHP